VDPREVLARPAEAPDVVVRYADHADGLIDVHLPPRLANTPAPLVVFLHGGFWRAEWDRTHTRPLAGALAAAGFVVATPEFRRVGGEGELAGGWPSTFDDVAAAMTALPGALEALGIATTGTTVAGHSAGGHLALWLAAEGLQADRVVGLAPVADLRLAAEERLGDGAVLELLGGDPDAAPDGYAAVDPAVRLATEPGCAVVVVHGTEDVQVPVRSSRGLAARHPYIDYRELDGAEHFALIDPLSSAWPTVLAAVRGQPPVD
jgi:acetyl esterase/lipase